MTSVALAHTHARSVLRKYIGVSITGALRGASEIPQRMVASGDSRPGRAALGSCESESWRSGMLRSRRWSRDEGFRAGRYYAAAKGCGWGQRPNSWTESSPFSHVGKAVTLGGGRG